MPVPDALRRHVHAFCPLQPDTWQALDRLFVRRELAGGVHFAAPAQPSVRIGLLETGCIRAYFVTPDGKEYNKHLFLAPDIVGDYAALLTGKPVKVPQQTLTPCVVWVADYTKVRSLESRHPELSVLARRYAEHSYLVKEQREIEIATMTATQRYQLLRERQPALENGVPQYHIAAYLGITPTQLSRIRAGLAQRE